MIKNEYGTAIVLYTFTNDEGNNKVTALKELLPDKIHKLDDQSSILIKSRCCIKDVENKLIEKYDGILEKNEHITLICVNGSHLRCMCIDNTPTINGLEKVLTKFLTESDAIKIGKQAKIIINTLHKNMSSVLKQPKTK